MALAQKAAGQTPTGEQLLVGVLSWEAYAKRRAIWDPVKQCVSLDARFYEGGEFLLWPTLVLIHAEAMVRTHVGECYLGIDPGEGGDPTAWAVTDDFGLVELQSYQTPDTSIICGRTLELAKKYRIHARNILFDRGGGGKGHADKLRAAGWPVRYVGFGDSPEEDENSERDEEYKQTYVSRRSQMYCEAAELFKLSPVLQADGTFKEATGYAVHGQELIRQMSLIPKLMDEEGRIRIPKKRHKKQSESKEPSLVQILGRSPDELDAFVLSVHARLHPHEEAPVIIARRETKPKRKIVWT